MEDRRVLAGTGPLLISEFMAVNSHTLADMDGESSDWIEVHNPTDEPVHLDGWHLTDDAGNLRRWEFPAITLDACEYLVVFASGKDRTDPAGELHTNFQLDGNGEYLALVQPDGVTISHAYAPQFPAQQEDVSYGLSQGTAETALVAAPTLAKTLVPTSGTLGQSWTQRGFDDAGWTTGTTGVGYDLGTDYEGLIGTDVQPAMYGTNGSVYTRIPFQVDDPAVVDSLRLRMKYDDGFTAYLNGTAIAQRNAPATPSWNSTATGEHGLPKTSSVAQDFEGGGTAYTTSMYGNGPAPEVRSDGPTGSYLRLVYDNVTWNVNRATFDRVLEGPASRVAADFDFRMHSPTNPDYPADGLSFLLLPTSMYGTSGVGSDGSYVSEEPNLPNTFAIGFDTYPEDWGVNDVSAHWNGVEIRNVRLTNEQLDLDAGVFHRVHVELVQVAGGMQVTVTLTPDIFGTPGTPITAIDGLFIPGMQPYESRAEFSGRTGGLFMDVDLDNIAVQFEPLITALEFQDFDVSQYRSELCPGTNVLAVQGLNVQPSDGDMLIVPELIAIENLPIQPEVETYFTTPTPGAANRTESDAPTERPIFSRASGTFVAPFSLTLTAPSPLATIRYTTDGSIPTESSVVYAGPLQINTTTRIRARAYQEGLAASPVVSHGYLSLDSTVAGFSSDLPLIVLDTFGMGLGDTWLTPATAVFIEPGQNGRAAIAAEPDFAGRAGLRIRGQSSQGFPKKQYAFETWAEGNEDTAPISADAASDLAVSLLGMPAESDWVIFGPYSDKSLMRNYLAYEWSNAIGMYAPRTQFVEVFVNTNGGALNYASDYVGVYVFMEKIKRDPDRVDIEELTPGDNAAPEVTGGYIYKKDKPGAGDQPWWTAYGQELRHVEPAADDITPQQQVYLEGYINDFERALYGESFLDPVTGYAQYIDVDSFIDNWILVEMCKNIDGFRLSTYYHKDRGDKIEMGPIWDYDLSLGNANYLDGGIPTGWYSDLLGDWDYPYWRRLFQDPEFEQKLVDRWGAYRQSQFSTANLLGDIDAAAAAISEAQARNFQTWDILGQYVWPNYYVAATWQDEIDWTQWWLQSRVEWMDSQFVAAPQITPDGGTLGLGSPVTMTAPAGTIYYTLDGSDPRTTGGGISPTAVAYTGPITLSATTLVRARALDTSRTFEWSALTETPYHTELPPTAGDVAIVEVNYHPTAPTPVEVAVDPSITASDFEFMEVMNASGHAISLLGTRFTSGIQFTFGLTDPRTLSPGERLVVAANPAALAARYGAVSNVVGPFAGSLDNAGELIRLVNAVGTELVAFAYDDSGGWPGRADGFGSTLELTDPAGDLSDDDSWRPSARYHGTPGAAALEGVVDIVVNEVLALPAAGGVDAIELYNRTTGAIDISGWLLSDTNADYTRFVIPPNTVVPANGYVVFDETQFSPGGGSLPTDFSLSGSGDDVWLLESDGAGQPYRFVDHVEFGPTLRGVSQGRWPNGGGDKDLPMVSAVTLNATNAPPLVVGVVINELHVDPTDKTIPCEYLELYNAGSVAADLSDWSLTGGIAYDFPAGTTLAPGSYLVVAQDPLAVVLTFGIDPSLVVGSFSGRLDNQGEVLVLHDGTGLVQDSVDYGQGFPWPTVDDAIGCSLQLTNPSLDNDLGGSWRSTAGEARPAETLLDAGSTWHYFPGTQEPSSPSGAWRSIGFDDSPWGLGASPIGYGEAFIVTPLAMRGNYSTLYLRQSFDVADPQAIASLLLEAQYDDGINVWINGTLVVSANVAGSELPYLGTAASAIENVEYVPFSLPDPSAYLVAGTNVIAVQLLNASLNGSSDAFFDARLTAAGFPGPAATTPGARNSVYQDNAPPQMRQVAHTPRQPASNEPVTITIKATDPDGVTSVTLAYQSVDPGDYISLSDPRYLTQWTTLPMFDDGTHGDAVSGDAVYTAVLPGELQTHRELVRYRITATDTLGASVTGPYDDDPQPNFAYFVYDGVPAWTGAVQPGVTAPVTYDSQLLSRVPTYHLITSRIDHLTSQSVPYRAGQADEQLPDPAGDYYWGSDYAWEGTLVYDAQVYDHIGYRARGGVWRYAMGKNQWKFDFARGHGFQARDDFGEKYDVAWDKLNLSALIQQGNFLQRGEQGLFESAGFELHNLAGNPAPQTNYVQLRIIAGADESGTDQYSGDFQGLYLAIEEPDGRFLDEHGLPDGNLYKMEGGTGTLSNQGSTQPTDKSDLNALLATYQSGDPTPPDTQWWRDNVDLEDYYSFRAIMVAIHDYDKAFGKNYYFYHNPETSKWSIYTWDLDLTWTTTYGGGGGAGPLQNDANAFPPLNDPVLRLEYNNRVRELVDLLFNTEQTGELLDQIASFVYQPGQPSLVDADRAMWDYNPILASSYVNGDKAGQGKFYEHAPTRDFAGMLQIMKGYVQTKTAAYLAGDAYAFDPIVASDEGQQPATPSVRYIGLAGFPIDDLRFQTDPLTGGSGTFAGMEWRIARVTDTTAPGYDPFDETQARYFEIQPAWESGTWSVFQDTIAIPGFDGVAGATYRVRVRMQDSDGRSSHWSEPVEFVAGAPIGELTDSLRITEVMYHPTAPTPNELSVNPAFVADDFEFLELHNTGSTAVGLTGVQFTKGVTFDFTSSAVTSLQPGEFVLIVKNAAAFAARYGTGLPVAGTYTGNLSNGGETIELLDPYSQVVELFTYDDTGAWPGRPDGHGSSLERIDTAADPDDGDNWRSSTQWGGSPGYAGVGPVIDVVVNEVLTHTDLPDVDAIELYNPTTADIDISYWWLSDTDADYQKFQIPAGTILPTGGYLVFDEGDFNRSGGVDADDFGLDGAHGDEVWLLAGDAGGQLTRFVDHVTFMAGANGESFGRWPDGSGDLYPMISQTLGAVSAEPRVGAANSGPRVGPIIISEIHYNPPLGGYEFIELYNTSSSDVPLYDPLNPTHTWKFDGVDFAFPAGTVLARHSVVLVVPVEPALFRAAYDVPAGVPIFGPYSGALNNAGERLQLLYPDEPPLTEPAFVPYLLADEVRYDDEVPWPAAPDGTGDSLQRISRAVWGNDEAHWYAAPPTPGHVPPAVLLANCVTTLPETTDTSHPVKVADIVIVDDSIGTNELAVTGANASQFEIVGATLYLKAGTVLNDELQASLSVGVSVDDPAVGRTPDDVQILTITVTHVSWQNPSHRCDVNGDGYVTPIDGLLIINYLNNHIGGTGLPPAPATPPPYYDVTNDRYITPIDVLIVINYLNRQPSGAGEGESAPSSWLFSGPWPTARAATASRSSARYPAHDGVFVPPVGVPARSQSNAVSRRDRPSVRRPIPEDSEALLDTLAHDVAAVRSDPATPVPDRRSRGHAARTAG